MFDHRIRQPFKQVFRELYVKLPEEMGLKVSRMFAGNQIQPQKTVGCLKGRRWVADYEEGLQKIYYKENIVSMRWQTGSLPAILKLRHWNGWNSLTGRHLSP